MHDAWDSRTLSQVLPPMNGCGAEQVRGGIGNVEASMGHRSSRVRNWGLRLLMVAGVGALATTAYAQSTSPSTPPRDALTSKLELMLRSMRIARDWHVEAPTKKVLVTGAIDGLLARLDPEAEFYAPAELRRFTRVPTGATADVGLIVRRDERRRRSGSLGYRVVTSLDGSPAARAGLKSGDLITHVNGQAASDLSYLMLTQTILSGSAAQGIALTVERAPDAAPETLRLARETVPVARAAEVVGVAPGALYVRPAEMTPAVAADIEDRLSRGGDEASRGIVLDLRSVALGTADGAAAMMDVFLSDGPLVAVATRRDDAEKRPLARPGDAAQGRSLAVLVDAETVGPAEAVALGLRRANRARLVGTASAGRFEVRTLAPLGRRGEKGAIRIVTARYAPTQAPDPDTGRRAIVPDVIVEQAPAHALCRGVDLPDVQAGQPICRKRQLAEDEQLRRALALLDDAVIAARP
jgi:carboxyl-terminal processing protease